jgi:formylglycine-generating enzyme required for sulfatase activity
LRGSEAAANDEPAVHITYDEAQAFCRWAGGTLLNDAQWLEAAYTERRSRGGSWWYGAAQMRADHLQGKPGETNFVYIGFCCVRQP